MTYRAAFFVAPILLVSACTTIAGVDGLTVQGSGGAGGGTASSSGTTSTGSSTSGGPLSCAAVDDQIGCCDASGVLNYCTQGATMAQQQSCASGTVCGWNASQGYYDCVPSSGADPSGKYPKLCSDVGSTSTSSSSSSSSSSTTSTSSSSSTSSSGGAVTWTELYTNIFGPGGSNSCVRNGGCHTFTQSGFKCGTTKTGCYTGMQNAGLISPGAGAAQSVIGDPAQSPLCGSLGGSMPQGGPCLTSASVTKLQSWLSAGAADN